MKHRSLRTTLIFWNSVVIVGLLGTFALTLVLVNQNRLLAALDSEMQAETSRIALMGPPRMRGGMGPGMGGPGMGGPGGPGMRPGMGMGGRMNELFGAPPDERDRDPIDPPLPEGEGPGPASDRAAEPDVYAAAERVARVRRPRFFDREGKPVRPMMDGDPLDPEAINSALRGNAIFTRIRVDDEPVRVHTRPIVRQDEVVGAVQVGRETGTLDTLWQIQARALMFLAPIAVIAAGLGGLLLSRRALRPVAEVTRTASEIGYTDLSRRLTVPEQPTENDDELVEMARTFNGMLDRLERSFEELKRFTGDASHELRTPLTRLRLATSSALEGAKSEAELRAALETADRSAEAMTRLVQQLLTLARADSGQLGLRLEPLDLRVAVAEALVEEDPRFELAFPDHEVKVMGDADAVGRIVQNLIENARRYTPMDRKIHIEVRRDGSFQVRDEGIGIPAEHLPRLRERFYRVGTSRTRADGGSGLGLAICDELVRGHGGSMEIESVEGVGTNIQVFFPLVADQTKSS